MSFRPTNRHADSRRADSPPSPKIKASKEAAEPTWHATAFWSIVFVVSFAAIFLVTKGGGLPASGQRDGEYSCFQRVKIVKVMENITCPVCTKKPTEAVTIAMESLKEEKSKEEPINTTHHHEKKMSSKYGNTFFEIAQSLAEMLHAGNFQEREIWWELVAAIPGRDGNDHGDIRAHHGQRDSKPSLYRAFQTVRSCLMEAGIREEREVIPIFSVIVTSVDFGLFINLLTHLDIGVKKFFFTVNGPAIGPRLFISALQLSFGSARIAAVFNRENEGVAPTWNNALKEGFEKTNPPVPYVVISNADVVPFPALLVDYARESFDKAKTWVVSRFAHFALFAVTKKGWEELGPFDEAIFPAYMEDVEYHVRAVSKGLGTTRHFGLSGNNEVNKVFWHLTAANRRENRKLSDMISAMNKEEYISRKWNVHPGRTVDFQFSHPYHYPWNNPLISHQNSWARDERQRECIKGAKPGTRCKYNYDLTKELAKSSGAKEGKDQHKNGSSPLQNEIASKSAAVGREEHRKEKKTENPYPEDQITAGQAHSIKEQKGVKVSVKLHYGSKKGQEEDAVQIPPTSPSKSNHKGAKDHHNEEVKGELQVAKDPVKAHENFMHHQQLAKHKLEQRKAQLKQQEQKKESIEDTHAPGGKPTKKSVRNFDKGALKKQKEWLEERKLEQQQVAALNPVPDETVDANPVIPGKEIDGEDAHTVQLLDSHKAFAVQQRSPSAKGEKKEQKKGQHHDEVGMKGKENNKEKDSQQQKKAVEEDVQGHGAIHSKRKESSLDLHRHQQQGDHLAREEGMGPAELAKAAKERAKSLRQSVAEEDVEGNEMDPHAGPKAGEKSGNELFANIAQSNEVEADKEGKHLPKDPQQLNVETESDSANRLNEDEAGEVEEHLKPDKDEVLHRKENKQYQQRLPDLHEINVVKSQVKTNKH